MDRDLISAFNGMYLVYNPRNFMDADQIVALMGQYRGVLRHVSAGDLNRASDIWQARKAKKFPLPHELGEILDLVKVAKRREAGSNEPPPAVEWEPCSREEFEALPPWAKVRDLRIRANAIRRQAGPMPHRTTIRQDQMPDEWKQKQARADHLEHRANLLAATLPPPKTQTGGNSTPANFDFNRLADV